MAKTTQKKKPMTKAQILSGLSDQTGLSKKDVESVLDHLAKMISANIKKTNDVFVLPGLLKIRNHRKEATKERQGINPKTGEKITIKARPAQNVVKVSALKQLKEMVK
jgi:nucleoid DNA-binding protein